MFDYSGIFSKMRLQEIGNFLLVPIQVNGVQSTLEKKSLRSDMDVYSVPFSPRLITV